MCRRDCLQRFTILLVAGQLEVSLGDTQWILQIMTDHRSKLVKTFDLLLKFSLSFDTVKQK